MNVHSLNQPSDSVLGGPQISNATLFDFWQWAFSDLCDDDVKGFFVEWLVHKLLGIESRRRISWANSDVVTPRGVTIEVKATSYWQSWKVLDQYGKPLAKRKYEVPATDSDIRFGGLKARDSTSTVDMTTERALKSDLYVFAFQHEKDITRWNAMELSQWEFYVLRAEEVAKLSSGRTVSLAKLRSIQAPLTAQDFVLLATSLIGTLEKQRSAV